MRKNRNSSLLFASVWEKTQNSRSKIVHRGHRVLPRTLLQKWSTYRFLRIREKQLPSLIRVPCGHLCNAVIIILTRTLMERFNSEPQGKQMCKHASALESICHITNWLVYPTTTNKIEISIGHVWSLLLWN